MISWVFYNSQCIFQLLLCPKVQKFETKSLNLRQKMSQCLNFLQMESIILHTCRLSVVEETQTSVSAVLLL